MDVTNIRSSGFDSPAQLREHMADLEDDRGDGQTLRQNADLPRQISELRTEVRELRKLVKRRTRFPRGLKEQRDDRFWLRLAATVAATFVVTAAVRYFRTKDDYSLSV
jgi:hypothetical protein